MFIALLVLQVAVFGLFVGILGYYFAVYRMRRNLRIRVDAAQEEGRRRAMYDWEYERYLLRQRTPPEEQTAAASPAAPSTGPAAPATVGEAADFEGMGGWKQRQTRRGRRQSGDGDSLRRTGS